MPTKTKGQKVLPRKRRMLGILESLNPSAALVWRSQGLDFSVPPFWSGLSPSRRAFFHVDLLG